MGSTSCQHALDQDAPPDALGFQTSVACRSTGCDASSTLNAELPLQLNLQFGIPLICGRARGCAQWRAVVPAGARHALPLSSSGG